MIIHCQITKGNGRYGKRPARGGIEDWLGEVLQNKSAHFIRVEMANELMPDGGAEPGILYSENLLRQIKSQTLAKKY